MAIGLLGMTALAGGIGLAGGAIQSGLSHASSKAQFNWQKQLEAETYARNRANYLSDLANERAYNSPQATIDRIRETGLNPNLMNGGALTSGQFSSGANQMSNGFGGSPNPVTFGNPLSDAASGLPSASNAAVAQRKADSEITGLKLSNEYKEIENSYLIIEKDLANEKTRTEIEQNLANIKKVFSDISVNDNTIKIGNRQYQLFGKQMKLLDRQTALTVSKTVMQNLNIEKARLMMPYCTRLAEADLLLKSARTSEAVESAYRNMGQAELAFTMQAKEQGLIDAGWADAYISQLKQSTEQAKAQTAKFMEETKFVGFNAKTARRRANASVMLGVSSLITAGCTLGKTIQSFQPSKSIFGGTDDTITTSGSQYLLDVL